MKRSVIIILTLVLTAAVSSGCRRKNMQPTTPATVRPTTEATTAPTTAATTAPTTMPTTVPTAPTERETIEGGIEDTSEPTGGDQGKARRMMPRGF